jgi:alpha-galactosidase
MPNVCFLGAGSFFTTHLATDVMLTPTIGKGEFRLVDIDERRLDLAEKVCRKIADAGGEGRWTVTGTTDRRAALRGADYVISCIEVSGVECVRADNDIPLKYGVSQCIGDTIGPGGLFKALRTVPVWLDVLRDCEELCPNAWVLNYTNPMNIMCLASQRTSARCAWSGCATPSRARASSSPSMPTCRTRSWSGTAAGSTTWRGLRRCGTRGRICTRCC